VLVCYAYNQGRVVTVERCLTEQLVVPVAMLTPRTPLTSSPMRPNARGHGG
jgi:hypothetical protein